MLDERFIGSSKHSLSLQLESVHHAGIEGRSGGRCDEKLTLLLWRARHLVYLSQHDETSLDMTSCLEMMVVDAWVLKTLIPSVCILCWTSQHARAWIQTWWKLHLGFHKSCHVWYHVHIFFCASKWQDVSGKTKYTSTLSKLLKATLKREEKSSALQDWKGV